MIDIDVLNFLAERLPVPVVMEIPPEPPESFVVIKRSGNGRENMIDESMFIADSYAPTLYDAAVLNENVKTAFDDLILLDSVARSSRGVDYPLVDTQSKRYRYQAVFNVTHY